MPSDGEKIRRWLQDIRHYVLMSESFIEGLAYPDFANDPEDNSRRDALSGDHLGGIATPAAGNIYRHEYEAVTSGEIWQTVTVHLPPLRMVVEQELTATGGL